VGKGGAMKGEGREEGRKGKEVNWMGQAGMGRECRTW